MAILQQIKVSPIKSFARIVIGLATCILLTFAIVLLVGAFANEKILIVFATLLGSFLIVFGGLKSIRAIQPHQMYTLEITPEQIRLSTKNNSGVTDEMYSLQNKELSPYYGIDVILGALTYLYFTNDAGKRFWVPLFMDNEGQSMTVYEQVNEGKNATYRLSIEGGQLNAFRQFAPKAKYGGKYVDVNSGLW